MSSKHKSRELAMQVLFLWDANGSADAEISRQVMQDGSNDPVERTGAMAIADGAWAMHEVSDQWVARLAPHWPTRRQPGVDRSLLRLAVWELTSTDTPPKVVIDEAIELAKEFSTEQSPSFVNGVLDAVLRERRALTSPDGLGGELQTPEALSPEPPAAAAITEDKESHSGQ